MSAPLHRYRNTLCTTFLCCVPLTCMVHNGDLCPWEMMGHTQHFSFFGGSLGRCKKLNFLYVFDGAQVYTTDTLPGCGASYMVHSAYFNPSILIGWHPYFYCEAFNCHQPAANPLHLRDMPENLASSTISWVMLQNLNIHFCSCTVAVMLNVLNVSG